MESIKLLILIGVVVLAGCVSKPEVVSTRVVYVVPEVPAGMISCPNVILPTANEAGLYTDAQVADLLKQLVIRGDTCSNTLQDVLQFYRDIRSTANEADAKSFGQ